MTQALYAHMNNKIKTNKQTKECHWGHDTTQLTKEVGSNTE
jgi:hypothetical protein